MKVRVITPANTLPPKASMYTGQIGEVIKETECPSEGGGVYYLVKFDEENQAAYLAYELKVIKDDL